VSKENLLNEIQNEEINQTESSKEKIEKLSVNLDITHVNEESLNTVLINDVIINEELKHNDEIIENEVQNIEIQINDDKNEEAIGEPASKKKRTYNKKKK
jgi:hypothetical protein